MIYLVESFYSIQGEGKLAGVPSLFFRFGGCNLKCPNWGEYFFKGKKVFGCDSVFAVNAKLFKEDWKKIEEPTQLIEIYQDLTKELDFKPAIVLTGGEPLLYWDDEVFYKFVEFLVKEKLLVTIETNGTIQLDFKRFPAYKEVIFSLSVKLSNSGEPYEKRVNKKALATILEHSPYSFFKFTLDKGLIEFRAFEEIMDIIEPFEGVEVFCMPLGDRVEQLRKNDKAVAEFCLIYGFTYSDRLQIRLWNRNRKR
ncbi:MAG: 7-carboxy-7-deazaguanine synthase QueE [Epsilonproteobacteria bacterium]|nr:7-carboxy-7-deazaguanine synthase QueE [Campylobacterota bacterium]